MPDTLPTESKWLRFDFDKPASEGRKTDIWHVSTKDDAHYLGSIRWFGRWRGYAFFPYRETVFEKQCLRDIAAFIETANKIHREKRKLAKQI